MPNPRTVAHFLAMALITLGATSAYGYSTTMSSNYGGTLGVGETVTVEVFFDTQGEADVTLLSVSVLFDSDAFTWAGSSPTYILYTGGKGANYLKPATTNLTLRVGTTNQLLIDFQNNILPGSNAASGSAVIATVTFHVDALGDGSADFALSNSHPGNILQLGDNSNPTNSVSGNFAIATPEPTTAVLVGLGLLGLGVAGRRRA